jgi:hypothetical protein
MLGVDDMTVKVSTGPYMMSTVDGLGMGRNWYPRIVKEAFLESKKDGEIQRCPDPVTQIDGDLTWYNGSKDPQMVVVQLQRAPRSVVAQSPCTVVIHDAVSWQVGKNPTAEFPSVMQDTFGGKLQFDRQSVAAADLQYCRVFYDSDSTQAWFNIGQVDAGESLHFRYLAACQTPGVWTIPSEFDPRWEASARWARLIAFASPVGSA